MKPQALTLAWAALCLLLLCPTHGFADRAHELAKKAKKVSPETCEDVTTMEECHNNFRTGCSNAPQPHYDAYLNYLKNQMPSPTLTPGRALGASDFADLEEKAPDTLSKKNHAEHAEDLVELGEGNIQAVIGYLYYVQPGGRETCNCMLTDPANAEPKNRDLHVGIGFDPAVAQKIRNHQAVTAHGLKQQSIIVEITPHYRAKHHPMWTLGRVRKILGQQVKVVGQIVIDNEHLVSTQDCGHPHANKSKCWRASAWQLHPVTQFYVCKRSAPCPEDSPQWEKLDEQP